MRPLVSSSPLSSSPLSNRLVDAACFGFALWTLCSHASVALGGSLVALIAVYGVALTLAAVGWVLGRHSLVPVRDPRLVESLSFQNF